MYIKYLKIAIIKKKKALFLTMWLVSAVFFIMPVVKLQSSLFKALCLCRLVLALLAFHLGLQQG